MGVGWFNKSSRDGVVLIMFSFLERSFLVISGCIGCVNTWHVHWCFSKMGALKRNIIGKYERVLKVKMFIIGLVKGVFEFS
jgi:hypothetical protein